MTERIPQSVSYLHVFKMFLANNGGEATGKTVAITISKNGGAFGNPNAGATNATEISAGWYKVTLDTTDTGTLGPLAIRGTASGCDDHGILKTVAKATNAGFTALPDAAADAAGGLPISDAGGLDLDARLDAAISSRMATYTQPTGFLAATFPSDPADQSLIIAATDALASLIGDVPTNSELATALAGADDAVLAQIALVKAKSDLIPGTQDGKTFAEAILLMTAILLGKVSGMDTNSPVFRSMDDTVDRVTATTDADGNRSAVSYDTSSP